MNVEWYLLLIILAGLVLFYLAAVVLYKPFKLLLSLALCAVTGVVLLWLLNLALGLVNMHVAFNPFTVLVAGIFQLPGLVLLVVLTMWFA